MKKIKMLVAGTGNPHVAIYLRSQVLYDAEIIAVSDFDAGRLETAKNTVPNPADVKFYSDYIAMFDAHPEADAVMIGSDNIDHCEMFFEAVRRNLHIFMMKVISMDENECLRMIAAADNYDRVVQCELELHFHPQFIYARELCRSGALGELHSVYLTNVSQSPINYYPNWGDPLLSYGKRIPIRRGSNLFRGGAITDHPHSYDMIRWITGHEFKTVHAVSSRNQRLHLEVEDHAAICGELDNGVKYFINPSYSNMEEKCMARRLIWPKSLECNLKLLGTKGYYSCDFFERPAYIVGNNYVSPDRLIVDNTPRMAAPAAETRFGSFVSAIRGERKVESTLRDSYAAVRVMNAAYDSIASGKTVTLPDFPAVFKDGLKQ